MTNTPEEDENIIFGKGIVVITDIKSAPDGRWNNLSNKIGQLRFSITRINDCQVARLLFLTLVLSIDRNQPRPVDFTIDEGQDSSSVRRFEVCPYGL